MSYNLTVSPDFSPERIAGWYIFNTWLQRALGEAIHLELYDDFERQRRAVAAGEVDLILANPYDAATLVRERGFRALARPAGKADEATIAVAAEGPIQAVEDLRPGARVATTRDPDVHMMGMIMIEPADLTAEDVELQFCDSYVLVAKQLFHGKADAGFFLSEAFDDLSEAVRRRLRALVRSQIHVIYHAFMVAPALREQAAHIRSTLLGMAATPKGRGVLEGMGIRAWESVEAEDMEFMIDLMDTLVD